MDVNLDGYKPENCYNSFGVNDIMYDSSESKIENLIYNIREMTEKMSKCWSKKYSCVWSSFHDQSLFTDFRKYACNAGKIMPTKQPSIY